MNKLLIIIALVFFSGCCTIEYPTKYGKAKYGRWFTDQKMNGLRIVEPNGIILELESQESKAEAVNILAGRVVELSQLLITKTTP